MPRTLKRPEPNEAVVNLQSLLSSHGYFQGRTPSHGIFDDVTEENVKLFQLQHIDADGNPLEPDGVVGDQTWWALKHPSGDAQRSRLQPRVPDALTTTRRQLLELILDEHAKPVFEVPDGSNRSPDIDNYWGTTGVIGLPWCCAFVSWALHEVLGRYPVGSKHHLGVQVMWREALQSGMETLEPKPGDVFIQIKSGGKGHTGFVVGVSRDGTTIFTGEGNCGNQLNVGKRPAASIDHYIDCLQDGQSIDFERGDFTVASLENETDR